MTRRDLSYLVTVLLTLCTAYAATSGIIMDVRGVPTFVLHPEAGYAMVALGLVHLILNGPLIRSYLHRWKRGASHEGLSSGSSGRREFLRGVLAALAGGIGGCWLGRHWSAASPSPIDSNTVSNEPAKAAGTGPSDLLALPSPESSSLSLDQALKRRRSIRKYSGEPLSRVDLSGLLHAAQGITDPRNFRAAPSAGALYPLETYVIVHRVEGLAPGLYRYWPRQHKLSCLREENLGTSLTVAGIGQGFLREANAVLVFTGVFSRIRRRYRSRGDRYILLEAGHAAQNTYLMAASLGLGACAVGAFDDRLLNQLLGVDGVKESAMYMMTVGRV